MTHVVCIGPHIVDVLVRPVTEIPPGQGGVLIEDARITAAGTAAGTSVDLAKLGARVTSIGAIGSDSLGRLLRMLLADHGVETDRLVTREGGRTSTTILPIRPNGERPTMHLPGVTATLTADDVDLDLVARADVLHLGGPDVLGPFATEVAPGLLRHARGSGTTTTVDLLRSGAGPDVLELLRPLWPWVDLFVPNDDQLRSMTGLADLEEAARVLRGLGVGTVVVTCGAEGSLIVGEGPAERVPAFTLDVVDTTGCGDAFTAGLVVGLQLGWDLPVAARLATAAAALVAQGLGSDAGIVDLPSTLAYWAERSDQVGVAPPSAQQG